MALVFGLAFESFEIVAFAFEALAVGDIAFVASSLALASVDRIVVGVELACSQLGSELVFGLLILLNPF